ncbi:hypothetical protein EIN_528530 [Entamoeba invadens IP1]|uniref:Uncharacterized protein n=1 Tax=Entamoeba invadens IP1 TaxID=370355 RepID=A0A0A1TZ25_ENTIV|nr:hypothetical protein EIN_528530 [Entamoeba invadens IP1]ELP86784.1 hypothetical protein EIN_528530 [Entamoeba invadens IP1]|eukprot:XP_004253555.1 hypothetical protein EIN_528530 [Entamoeba invadens IP1]
MIAPDFTGSIFEKTKYSLIDTTLSPIPQLVPPKPVVSKIPGKSVLELLEQLDLGDERPGISGTQTPKQKMPQKIGKTKRGTVLQFAMPTRKRSTSDEDSDSDSVQMPKKSKLESKEEEEKVGIEEEKEKVKPEERKISKKGKDPLSKNVPFKIKRRREHVEENKDQSDESPSTSVGSGKRVKTEESPTTQPKEESEEQEKDVLDKGDIERKQQ